MKDKVKFLIVIIFVLLFFAPIFIDDIVLGRSNSADRPVAPHLVYPVNEEISLIGDSLEFKWWHANIGIDRYEFMLYRSGGSSGDVILKKTLPFSVSSIQVAANLLEDNQVYTWTLRQIADNGLKSDKSFVTFRIKKQKK